jgi:hypothetical protein
MIFSEKSLRALLIAGSGAVSLLLWAFALKALVQNFPLKEQVVVKIQHWEVEEVKTDRFALRALYTYDLGGRTYQGNTLFQAAYLNQFSAIAGLKEASKSQWTAWVNPSRPAQSSLEKIIPFGFILRAFISSAVMLYFVLVYRRKYFKTAFLNNGKFKKI